MSAYGGVSLASKKSNASGQPLKHGEYSQASRAVGLGSYFLSGLMAVNASQFLGAPLYLINRDWYNAWIAFTKQSFGLLVLTLTQCWAPTVMKVSGDASVRGQMMKTTDGQLLCDFPERLVLIANHQIYTDWLYLWWIAYANGMHGRLFIVLKESLKRIPLIGWGMQFSQFIFLKRNWEQDKPTMAKALQRLNQRAGAMWLMLFPEGTNLAASTREKSNAWAKKTQTKDMQHCLLPRSTGLQFCLQELRQTVDYVYDCTIAYEGVPRGEYAQDIFTLKAAYMEGRPPKSVSMYWRRFKISSIPIDNDKAFELWLRKIWQEKDYLLELYHRTGRFPSDSGVEKVPNGTTRRGCGVIETQVKSSHWYEFLQIFAPMGILALVLYAFYGALPNQYRKSIKRQATRTQPDSINTFHTAGIDSNKVNYYLDSILDADKQEKTFKSAVMNLQKLATMPQTQALVTAFPSGLANDLWKSFASDEARKPRTGPKRIEQASPNAGNFLQALQSEEARRSRQAVVETLQKSYGPAAKGTFWENLQAEQASRHGSVITQSSQSSSPSGRSVKSSIATAPSTRASSVSGGTVGRPSAVKPPASSKLSTVNKAPIKKLKPTTQKTTSNQSATNPKPQPTKASVRGKNGVPTKLKPSTKTPLASKNTVPKAATPQPPVVGRKLPPSTPASKKQATVGNPKASAAVVANKKPKQITTNKTFTKNQSPRKLIGQPAPIHKPKAGAPPKLSTKAV